MNKTILRIKYAGKKSYHTERLWRKIGPTRFEWGLTKIYVINAKSYIWDYFNPKQSFSSAEKELEVLIGNKMNISQESTLAASCVLGCVSKSTASRSRKVAVPQSLAFIRPQLEHCALVWPPKLQRNIKKLERTQRGVMKVLSRLLNLTWRIGFAHPREGKALGGCSHSLA